MGKRQEGESVNAKKENIRKPEKELTHTPLNIHKYTRLRQSSAAGLFISYKSVSSNKRNTNELK
jgi:hypothetical protein